MARCESYVLCTSPRSGSTLLCNMLATTGVAGNPDSHFHEPSIEAWLGYYGLKVDTLLPERDVLATIFRAAITEGRSDTGMFGLRLQRHSFGFFTEKLAVLYPEQADDAARFKAAFGQTLFIHLTRADKVEQAVSYVKAQQSGLWHRAPDGTELERLSPPRELAYNAGEIRSRVEEMTAYDREWERWFAAEKIDPLRLTYDALAGNPIEMLRRVLERLGLDRDAATAGLEPGVARLADATSRDWVTRFRAEHGVA